jgi:hypothetical protein
MHAYENLIDTFCFFPVAAKSKVAEEQGDQIGQFFTNWATFGGSL